MAHHSLSFPIPAMPINWSTMSRRARLTTTIKGTSTMMAILNRVPISLDAPRLVAHKPLVEIKGLSKRYGRIRAVDQVDLDVYPGEVLGIVGESGSGKSTVLRLLNLQESADAGVYRLNIPQLRSANLLELDRFQKREIRTLHIGVVYQHPHLGLRMHYTSSGNVAERLLITGERNFATLRSAAQESLAASEFPPDRMDDPPILLSGG